MLRNHAGAKALCCSSHAEVKEMMSAAPRWVVHQALAERTPATYTARQTASEELGISPDMEDAAIAYRLLLEVTAPLSGLVIQYVVRSEWHTARTVHHA